ncbi:amino acid ABC transporter permease [Rubellimicrobium sp. CFH 75288]|uniref:amino acid ABC transporter permease n=1 Tax=Rubellimicrobium sp. CFH 75288 TaxID=2697034 RepID=UPI001411CD50|nr:amino acid ABC transporter permease [Rubellimicrobium sp. CFH 75288]NAZ35723.1 ABC transporter permease subunit [Rubellimicrobium sp. CFH 75288]
MGFDTAVFWGALTSAAFARGAALTLALAALAHAAAIVIAIPLAILLRRPGRRWRWPVVAYVGLFRAIPTLLLLLIVWNALPQVLPALREPWFTPFLAAFVALALNEAAYQVEINRAALAAVDEGQIAAGDALGLKRWQTFRLIVLPQAVRTALPPTVNEFITLLKLTSLASVISLQELMTVTQITVARTFQFAEHYAAALVYYLVMVFGLMALQARIERRFAWSARAPAASRRA